MDGMIFAIAVAIVGCILSYVADDLLDYRRSEANKQAASVHRIMSRGMKLVLGILLATAV
ncbi:MAG: hypothetical protein Q7S05_04660 [bacterium]|nr:hypothetical protein [bacterium]